MSRARDLSRLSNQTNFTTEVATGRVGLGSENPTSKFNVAGIVSATAFYGDGSNLEGVASAGLGTALAESGAGTVIYYTDKVLGVAANITVDVPDASSSNVAYTQYEEISVNSGIDFIVADGDDFVPDILGISSDVQTPGVLAGGGGRVRADNFSNKAGTGAPTFPAGVNITGVATATTFSGALSGNVTGNASGSSGSCSGNSATATVATNAQGLTGTPDIAVRNITGVAATFTGVLTYEDVTNIDSIGIVTARTGVRVNAGGIIVTAGISTIGAGVSVTGPYKENITAMGALEVDCSTGNYFTKTIAGNSTFTFANVPTGCAYAFTLELTHSSGTVTWPASVKFPADTAPTLTTGKTHLFMFITDDGGTRFRGSSLVDYVN